MMASNQLKLLEHASFPPSESGEFQYYGETQTFRIALIHEMIHAYYGLIGEGTASDSAEEKKVVGIYEFRDRKYTENKFRFLLDLPLRDDYKRLGIESDIELWPECETWCNFRSDWQ